MANSSSVRKHGFLDLLDGDRELLRLFFFGIRVVGGELDLVAGGDTPEVLFDLEHGAPEPSR